MKSLALYLLVVGLPLAGLVAVLRAGDHLGAPRSVGGRWKLDADVAGARALAIVQSGPRLEVTLGAAAGSGTLEGDALRARGAGFTLEATLGHEADPALVGTCSLSGARPSTVSFHASRVQATRGEER